MIDHERPKLVCGKCWWYDAGVCVFEMNPATWERVQVDEKCCSQYKPRILEIIKNEKCATA